MQAFPVIRTEKPSDYEQVAAITEAAFKSHDYDGLGEVKLIKQLRIDGDATLSIVADLQDEIVGHVMFSALQAPMKALALAPVSVSPDHQKTGIGSALINKGIDEAKARGFKAVFVLGDPNYYSRFGFEAGLAKGYTSPYAGPYFQALGLNGFDFSKASGDIIHAPAFSNV